jgi:acetyl-CoA carboxylase carboxyl transferase subunit alpha
LWKSGEFAEDAARALRFTSKDLLGFGIVDHVIEEPLGGAHREPYQTAARLKQFLIKTLRELTPLPKEKLLQLRYEKFRRMGVFLEEVGEQAAVESGR